METVLGKRSRSSVDEDVVDSSAKRISASKVVGDSAAPAPVSGVPEASRAQPAPSSSGSVRKGTECPYMHTINIGVLDFDFEKVCSVSLESHNVYACLVCGRYFQGRGPSSHAFAHAVDADHHLFINLQTEKTYCLPDGYRVEDPALVRIADVMHPKFSSADVRSLAHKEFKYRTLHKTWHTQGVTALDNLHACDYANVVFTALLTVPPLRDYLLLARHDTSTVASSAKRSSTPSARFLAEFCVLAQKVWSPCAFRAHVSPHEIMQQVASASDNRFSPLVQSDPVDFFTWLIHALHKEVSRTVKREKAAGIPQCKERANRNLLRDCFQGSLEVITIRDADKEGVQAGGDKSAADGTVKPGVAVSDRKEIPFWFLSLDLPPKPMFKDASERTLVPQVPLRELLAKYDGASQHHVVKTGERLSYRLKRLPPFLVLTVKRVTKSKFVVEKNPAVLHCPAKDLDMANLCPDSGDESQVYHLLAVVVHDGPHDRGTYFVASRHPAGKTWHSIRNLTVSEVLPQLVTLGETCMLLYGKDSALQSEVSRDAVGNQGSKSGSPD